MDEFGAGATEEVKEHVVVTTSDEHQTCDPVAEKTMQLRVLSTLVPQAEVFHS